MRRIVRCLRIRNTYRYALSANLGSAPHMINAFCRQSNKREAGSVRPEKPPTGSAVFQLAQDDFAYLLSVPLSAC
jgi:hypothetical protein